MRYYISPLDGEYVIVFDPIAAKVARLPSVVLGGYTTRQAAIDAAELLLED